MSGVGALLGALEFVKGSVPLEHKRAIVYGALVAARRLHGSAAARRLGPLHLRWWRHAECSDELVYVLLRERFIRPPHKAHAAAARRMTVEHHEYGGATAKKAAAEAGSEDLPPDFDFSNYLRRRCFEIVAMTLHVSTAEDSDDDDDAERTYAFPPPVDLDAYAAACRLPPAEETEDEREARFQRERCFGL